MQKKDSNINELFKNSAEYIDEDRHPMDCLAGSGQQQIKKLSLSERIINKFKKIKYSIKEKKENKRFKNLTEIEKNNEAKREFGIYYKLLYDEKLPNYKEFKRLLIKYGSPDYANPYSSLSIGFHYYHELGFIGADINAILEYTLIKRNNQDEILESSLEKIEIKDSESNQIILKRNYNEAIVSWAYIVVFGNGMKNFIQKIHKDNIEVATIEMLMNIDIKNMPFDYKDIVYNLNKYNLLSDDVSMAILRKIKKLDI